jgi:secreted trypsin-like serine protease
MSLKAFLPILLCMSMCHAGTIDPRVPDSKYVEYGEQHECVVPIYGDCECEDGGGKPHKFAASAVVLGPRWVVTAAHVVRGTSGVRVRVRGKEYAIRKVVVNKHFDPDKIGLYDIAMGNSEEDMELPFYPDLYEDKNEEGKVASMCGYGVTGTFGSGAVRSDNKKRAGSNVIDRIENHVVVCSLGTQRHTNMEFMISHGDSGGGLFIDQKLAGINSFVSATDGKPNSDYGDECHHTRISIFAPWIRGNMNGEEPDGEVR